MSPIARCLVAASSLLVACLGVNPDQLDAPGPEVPPLVYPSTDLATARPDMGSAPDLARDAWVCVPAYQADGTACGCADMPCCRNGELAAARTANGLPASPNDYCNGVTSNALPLGYAEECTRYGVNVYRCRVVR